MFERDKSWLQALLLGIGLLASPFGHALQPACWQTHLEILDHRNSFTKYRERAIANEAALAAEDERTVTKRHLVIQSLIVEDLKSSDPYRVRRALHAAPEFAQMSPFWPARNEKGLQFVGTDIIAQLLNAASEGRIARSELFGVLLNLKGRNPEFMTRALGELAEPTTEADRDLRRAVTSLLTR